MPPASAPFTELVSHTLVALEETGQPGQPPPRTRTRTRTRPIFITTTATFTEINTVSLVVAPTSSSTPEAKSSPGTTSTATFAPNTSSVTNTAAASAPTASASTQTSASSSSVASQLFTPGSKLFVVGVVIIGLSALIFFAAIFFLVRCALRRKRARSHSRPRKRSMSEKRNTSSNGVRPDRASDFWSADVNRSRGRSASFHSPESASNSPKTPNEDAGLLKTRARGLFEGQGTEAAASEIRDVYIRSENAPHSNPMRVHFTPSVAMSDYTTLSLDVQQPTSARASEMPRDFALPTTPTLVHRSLAFVPNPSQSSSRHASNPFLEDPSETSVAYVPKVPPPVPPRSSARQSSSVLASASVSPPEFPRRASTDIESIHSNPFQFDELSRSPNAQQGIASAPMVSSPTDFRTSPHPPPALQTDVSHVLAHLRHRLSDTSSALSDSPSEDKPQSNEGPGYFMHVSPISPGPHAQSRTSIHSLSPSQVSLYSTRSGPLVASSTLDGHEISGEREAKASMAGLRPEGSRDDVASPALADSTSCAVRLALSLYCIVVLMKNDAAGAKREG
ncbi:hypothetical protein BDV93DRAFT_508185 [Ceratobasidium sp. AG-I]|nr:hypothetical protein BDV93DRAFT_508185 [Ceratobasidium sp. AG-I]